MFATRMVGFIQKLLGRDGGTTADGSTDDVASPGDVHPAGREEQAVSGDFGYHSVVSNSEQRQDASIACESFSLWSGVSSSTEFPESGKFSARNSFIHGERAMLDEQNSDMPASRRSTCEVSSSSSSCKLTISSEDHHQRYVSSVDDSDSVADAEPVCCCDACVAIANSNTSSKENQLSSSLVADTRNVSDSLPLSLSCGQLTSCGIFPSARPRSRLPSITFPETHPSVPLVKNSSSVQLPGSTAKEKFHFPNSLLHKTEQDLDTHNLPPMICISPDGEESFANSQRHLKNTRNKPFSEVPPNKTICHVHCKFVSNK